VTPRYAGRPPAFRTGGSPTPQPPGGNVAGFAQQLRRTGRYAAPAEPRLGADKAAVVVEWREEPWRNRRRGMAAGQCRRRGGIGAARHRTTGPWTPAVHALCNTSPTGLHAGHAYTASTARGSESCPMRGRSFEETLTTPAVELVGLDAPGFICCRGFTLRGPGWIPVTATSSGTTTFRGVQTVLRRRTTGGGVRLGPRRADQSPAELASSLERGAEWRAEPRRPCGG